MKRACGMPGQPNCVDIQDIVKQEEPIATTGITLKRRCPPETGCFERKEKDEEPENTPIYKPAPKMQCEPGTGGCLNTEDEPDIIL